MALLSETRRPLRVLVLGGGDGLAAREILRYPEVSEVVLVELDPEMTRLAVDNPMLRELNDGSLSSPRVRIENEDALIWLGRGQDLFDAAFVDFPDPHNFSLGKLYTTRFYRLLRQPPRPRGRSRRAEHLAADGATVVLVHQPHPGSGRLPRPSLPRPGAVLRRVGLRARNAAPRRAPDALCARGCGIWTAGTLRSLFVLGPDMAPVATEVNRLNNQTLVHYYEEEMAALELLSRDCGTRRRWSWSPGP